MTSPRPSGRAANNLDATAVGPTPAWSPFDTGVSGGIAVVVQSIGACPTIQSGSGRVVLATVSHLNDDVYNLTLKNGQGITDTLGVTGTHEIYTEDRGWVEADDLTLGEQVRGQDGDLTVTSLTADPGTFTVYDGHHANPYIHFRPELTQSVSSAV